MRCVIILFLLTSNLSAQSSSSSIETYCKVWWLCKYYTHTNGTDWDEVFFKDYNELIVVQDNDKLNILLERLIKQTHLKETVIIDSNIGSSFTIDDFSKLKNKHGKLVLKTDFSWIFNTPNISPNNQQLLRLLLQTYKGKKPETISGSQIIAHNKEKIYDDYSPKIALLAMFRFYNAMEYYYPYKHLLDNDWDSVLSKVVPLFLNCHSSSQYEKSLKIFSSYLQDSHVWIKPKEEELFKEKPSNTEIKERYPITFEILDDVLFISNILNDSIASYYSIKQGDTIVKVNNVSVDVLIDKKIKSSSYSRSKLASLDLVRDLQYLDTLNLTLTKRKTIRIKKYKTNPTDRKKLCKCRTCNAKKNIKLISDSIAYIYLPSTTYRKVDNLFRAHKDAATIILDCRGYGSMASLKLAKLLNNKPQDVASMYLPTKKYPGVFVRNKNENYYFSNTADVIGKALFRHKGKVFPTFNRPYKGKIVVLIDESAQSFGETVIMLIKSYAKDVVLIGHPTTGANGNVTTLNLPLGKELYYTGIDFRFADGTELQRKGIQPDMYVPRTIKGILNQEDEILNAALKYIENGR